MEWKEILNELKIKKNEIKILEFNKKLDIIKDSKDEIENRLDKENRTLSNV